MTTQTTAERRGTGTLVSVSVALQTAAIFFQAITAGIMLGTHHGEVLHSVGARVMFAASMLYVLAAVLGWKPGGGSPAPSGTRWVSCCSPRSRWCWASTTSPRCTYRWAC
ncbi:hypothetical protein [Actinocatenispora thailandica]|uniref:hypothetical protein n=1 Tax=Actinocatenispora thailandica TaxID=227318 RepID=UPI00194F8767|nr:hypothetical protein [Actinocatenispora thailandica]